MKKIIYIIFGEILLLSGVGYYLYQQSMRLATYSSTVGNCELITQRERGIFTPTSDSSIEIEWDLENNQVWYGRGKTINLKTGEVGC